MNPEVFSGEGIKTITGTVSQKAHWKQLHKVIMEAWHVADRVQKLQSLNESRMKLYRDLLIFILKLRLVPCTQSVLCKYLIRLSISIFSDSTYTH